MKLSDVNPFLRYAELQPSVISTGQLRCSYDYRIFYILEGSANFILSDKAIPISAGTLIYFRPGTPYYFDGKVKVIVLNFDMSREQADKKEALTPTKIGESFDAELIFENQPPKELSELAVIADAFEIENKIQECLLHYCYPSAFSDSFTSAIIKYMLCYIVQKESTKLSSVPEIVQRINLYIQQNYDQELSNTQIASEFGYHSFYLNRVFKRHTGITIHQAVLLEKMRIAKSLLKETDLSVNSVAHEVGFFDSARFCTAFKKYAGCTPKEYRIKNKLN